MSVRAKFRCQSIKEMPGGEGTMKEVVLNPVYGNGEENKQWSK
jgi:hypothetical protein